MADPKVYMAGLQGHVFDFSLAQGWVILAMCLIIRIMSLILV
jgi:hypothetical protein